MERAAPARNLPPSWSFESRLLVICLACAALQGILQHVVGRAVRGAAGICRHDDASIEGMDIEGRI